MRRSGKNAGLSLVAVLVGVAMAGILVLAMGKMFGNAYKAKRTIELRGDLEQVRQQIFYSLDCDGTFASAGINPASPGSACDSTSALGGQTSQALKLRRKTKDGTVQYLFGSTLLGDGSVKVGDWRIRATCSTSEQSLVIRAARLNADGTSMKDTLNSQKSLGWYDAGALLFGGAAGSRGPLCYAPADVVEVATGRVGHGAVIAPPAGFARSQCRLLLAPEDHHGGPVYTTAWGDGNLWGDNHYGGGIAYFDAAWNVSCQFGLHHFDTLAAPMWIGGSCRYMAVCEK